MTPVIMSSGDGSDSVFDQTGDESINSIGYVTNGGANGDSNSGYSDDEVRV